MQITSGNFTFTETKIQGLVVVDVKVWEDDRGWFLESYKESCFREAGLKYSFVQDSQSGSRKGVLRGLHFQKQFPQAKLVRVLRGEVFDVAVDLRKDSTTFGQWYGTYLSEENRRELMIPRGFAHGFAAVSDYAEIAYKSDEFYHPEDEAGILWNDPDIGIRWPEEETRILSKRDRENPRLKDCEIFF